MKDCLVCNVAQRPKLSKELDRAIDSDKVAERQVVPHAHTRRTAYIMKLQASFSFGHTNTHSVTLSVVNRRYERVFACGTAVWAELKHKVILPVEPTAAALFGLFSADSVQKSRENWCQIQLYTRISIIGVRGSCSWHFQSYPETQHSTNYCPRVSKWSKSCNQRIVTHESCILHIMYNVVHTAFCLPHANCCLPHSWISRTDLLFSCYTVIFCEFPSNAVWWIESFSFYTGEIRLSTGTTFWRRE